jgi:nucleoside-diphosphate-sugar epimerase
LSDRNIHWESFQDATVLVTGTTGVIGGALVAALSAANERYNLNLRLVGYGQNKDKGEVLAQNLGLEFVCGDIRKPTALSDIIIDEIDYLFHCAAITKSTDMVARPVDVILTAVDGTRNMLELARTKACKSFLFLSSMEYYGQTEPCEIHESDLGYLDLSNPRSCYPESKRLCEMLCYSYFTQYGLPTRIARLAQSFGAGISKDDTRVFAQFARSAFNGDNLELHTDGKSRGNYCYLSDAVRGLLTILLKGKSGESYNVANPSASTTIREMAEIVANEVCGCKIKVVDNVPEDIDKRGYAPNVRCFLNVDKLTALGWSPRFGLADMYRRVLSDWQGL